MRPRRANLFAQIWKLLILVLAVRIIARRFGPARRLAAWR